MMAIPIRNEMQPDLASAAFLAVHVCGFRAMMCESLQHQLFCLEHWPFNAGPAVVP